ncbi:SDR family NAD(P)-dependent oxidoreductase [Kiloniella sp. b19]|uniref:SDR family NAD(P)-dependent oxidoreductase n=1 Tax=Kiloniella sp. GXU_MW_B19 TaxID=3141326 RepID=UPI0031D841FB
MNTHAPLAIIAGFSSTIGRAMTQQLLDRGWTVLGFSRRPVDLHHDNLLQIAIDFTDEASIEMAAGFARDAIASRKQTPDLILETAGILHSEDVKPEKALRDMNMDAFLKVFQINTFGPALIMKHFLPLLPRQKKAVFAALSARVGSISDNQLGGWYAYRASKAALNMLIRNAAIETGRRNKNAVIVGLHPGTVDSPLSKPFQGAVPEGKLFTADYSADRLLSVLETLTPQDSGELFAWDGERISP